MKSELALKIRVSTGKKPAKMMVTIDKVLKSIAAEVILIDQHVVLNWMTRPAPSFMLDPQVSQHFEPA